MLSDLDTVYVYRVADTSDWVDLGLPNGLLWAKCNVGANAPEDYGDYFDWAEISPKSVYDQSTYIYCCNNNHYSLTKYCYRPNYGCDGFTDTLTILQPDDDAATVSLGVDARTPTIEEWQELNSQCTSEWTTQNGVKGRVFTGPNGNSLFLPATGFRDGNGLVFVGDEGDYWSSSLDTFNLSFSWYFQFNSAYANTSHSAFRDWGWLWLLSKNPLAIISCSSRGMW
ncbi:MAG: hypothetical protein IJ057_11845 [Bacteroidales bacterium]|nr:hypothetical protein [Bacteroidales bacterium]